MSAIAYLNGSFLPSAKAQVSVEDRGFLFADGVYEVVRYYAGKPFTLDEHVERLKRSLSAMRIELDWKAHDLPRVSEELLVRNKLRDAQVYWQITRGVAPRKHLFPKPPVPPTVVALAYPEPPLDIAARVHTMRAITRPDIRWRRCSIKSTNLLPNLLDSQAASEAGADTAILVRDGIVTECPSRSLFVVEKGTLYTYPLDGTVLDSITRRVVIELAREANLPVREERVKTKRLFGADEVFVVGTTTEIAAVVEIDRKKIGGGDAGTVTRRLLRSFVARVYRDCGFIPGSPTASAPAPVSTPARAAPRKK